MVCYLILGIILKPLMWVDRIFLSSQVKTVEKSSVMVLKAEKAADGCLVCWVGFFCMGGEVCEASEEMEMI